MSSTINIGGEATDRGSATGSLWTFVQLTNPASEAGIVNTIEVWANTNLTGPKVAIFYLVDADIYATRDWVQLGLIEAGEHTISNGNPITTDSGGSPISLSVQIGDFIGHYFSGNIEHDLSGFSGVYRLNSDEIPSTGSDFTSLLAGDCSSMKGLWISLGNPIFVGTNF